MARSTSTAISDAAGWTLTIDADPSTTPVGGGGTVYALSVVNNSAYDLTLWWVIAGQTQSIPVASGLTETQVFASPSPGQVASWGVY